MKLTKYEHACVVLTKGDDSIVIDPGAYTLPLGDLDGVVGIVITHEHADHWTPEQLHRILDRNPDARILGPAGVVAAASDFTVETAAPGETVEVGPFQLTFTGGRHAVIHESIPVIDNVGVLVDGGAFYYPGDSFALPEVEVDVLALPAGAPWLKVGEAMDFLLAVKPKRAFPTHDATISQIGKDLVAARFEWAAKEGGGQYFVLQADESSDL